MDGWIARLEREAGLPGLTAALAESLKPTDLQSLLLEVHRQRAARRTPADVLRDYAEDRFVRPSAADGERLRGWQAAAHALLPPEFAMLELSPVTPLGTCSAVAGVSQGWSVATDRNTEVVSDVTNVLALEAALRRRADRSTAVHLAAGHRVLRAQKYDGPGMATHFHLLGLVSSGRQELAFLLLHLDFHLRLLHRFGRRPLAVELTDLRGRHGRLEREVAAPLRQRFPGVTVRFDPERASGRGYYRDVCFHVNEGDVQLVDGGVVDWTARLLGDARERLVISGVGSERGCAPSTPRAPVGGASGVGIEPFAERHIPGFHATLDAVARERRYLMLLEAGPLEVVEGFLRHDLRRGVLRFVALDGERVVGWCDVSPHTRAGTTHCGSLGMGLLPEYRGRGLGSRLMEATLDAAFARGLQRVELDVFASNRAGIALYERFGFQHEGVRRRARYLDGAWDDLVLMALVRD